MKLGCLPNNFLNKMLFCSISVTVIAKPRSPTAVGMVLVLWSSFGFKLWLNFVFKGKVSFHRCTLSKT